MTAIDLFAGAGGMSLGLMQAGFDVKAAVEFDLNAAKTYKKNHKDAVILEEDISQLEVGLFLEKSKLKKNEIFLIAGGPPCQGFSMANGHSRNHKNPEQDEKNQMVIHFIKYVKNIQPEVFIMENVLGFKSMQEKFKPPIIDRFIKAGYKNTKLYVLNSAEYGVPQIRRRVFVIGTKTDRKIIFEPLYSTNQFINVKEALFGDLPPITNGIGYRTPIKYEKDPITKYQKYLRKGSSLAHNHITTINNEKVKERFGRIKQGQNGLSLGEDIGIEIQFSSCYKRLDNHKPSITMSNFRKSMIMHPRQNRILSIREAARIQSFPDSFIFEGGISSMQQQVGNAVPPILAVTVGNIIYNLFSD
jgi:DNA (cytosine-5)-methyltransferase 1